MSQKLSAGAELAPITLKTAQGGEVTLGGKGRWQFAVVYRGKHCPLCKPYLESLEALKADLEAQEVEVLALSTDPKGKAEAQVSQSKLSVPVAYDLSLDQARSLGLYISTPRSAEETDRPFAEPGVFVINPDGQAQIIDISNAPFARPDLAAIARGLAFIRDKGYPIRGTHA